MKPNFSPSVSLYLCGSNFKSVWLGLRLRLRKMEELGLRVQITISTDFTEV